MTFAALYLTVLRIIHIFAAVTWVGGGVFNASVLAPTVRDAGPEGGRFMLQVAKSGRLARVLTMAALTTVVAGLLLYWPTSGGLNGDWLKTAQGITLTLGAIIGIVAMLHGVFITGPITRKLGAIAKQILDGKGPPAPELLKQVQAMGAQMGTHSIISMALGATALLCMAAAQTI